MTLHRVLGATLTWLCSAFGVGLGSGCSEDPSSAASTTSSTAATSTMETTASSAMPSDTTADTISTGAAPDTTTSQTSTVGTTTDTPTSGPGSETGDELDRVLDGLVVLYRFNAGGGTIIQDVSGVGDPLDLSITSAAAVSWGAKTLTVNSTVRMLGTVPPQKIVAACSTSEELTMEVWVRAASDTATGAVILSLSTAMDGRAFTLGQSGGQYDFRLNAGMMNLDGLPAVEVAASVTRMSHVVYTRDAAGDVEVYLDGASAATDSRPGAFSNWPAAAAFVLTAEVDNTRPFLGEFGLAAVYCRALTGEEVTQNFDAGF